MADQTSKHLDAGDVAEPAVSLVVRRVFSADAAISPENRDRLYRLAYRFLWDRHDAEDVVQEALAAAYEQRDALRDEGKWWPWMCRIVVNGCRAHGRTRKRIQARDEVLRAQGLSVEQADETGTADRAHLKRQLQAALLQLPRRQREVVVLRHLEQMDYHRIAEILHLAPETVRVHARSGLERLQRLMRTQVGEGFGRAAHAED